MLPIKQKPVFFQMIGFVDGDTNDTKDKKEFESKSIINQKYYFYIWTYLLHV